VPSSRFSVAKNKKLGDSFDIRDKSAFDFQVFNRRVLNMSRPLRIEYPDAWYHVMNRGRRSEEIFFTDTDREEFLHVLHEAAELMNLKISAYCLIPNHNYGLHITLPSFNPNSRRKLITLHASHKWNLYATV